MGQYGNEALSLLNSRLNLALQQDKANYKNTEADAVTGLQQQLAANQQADASGAYDYTGDPELENLPLQVRLGLQAKLSKGAKDSADAQARYGALSTIRAARQQFAQAETDRRTQLMKTYEFQSKAWDDVDAQAPQLESLRGHIEVQPRTGVGPDGKPNVGMSYQYTKDPLTPKQLQNIRDQEIADFYGVDVGLVKAKRIDNDDEMVKREFEDMNRAWAIHERNRALDREKDDDELHDWQMTQMRLQKRTSDIANASREWGYAESMPELVANRYLADPNTDSEIRQIAQLSKDIRDSKFLQLDVKDELQLKQKIANMMFTDHVKLYGNTDDLDPEQVDATATAWAHKQFPLIQKYRKEAEKQRASLVGGGSDADKIYNKVPGSKSPTNTDSAQSLSDADLDQQIAQAQRMRGRAEWITQGGASDNRPYEGFSDWALDTPGMDTLGRIGTYLNSRRRTQ